MNIGIDLRWLHQALSIKPEDECTGGIGAYSYSLVNYLLKLDSINNYVLFGSNAFSKELLIRYFKESNRLKIVLLPRSPQISVAPATLGRIINYFYQQVVVAPKVRRESLDVMHFQEQGAVILNGRYKKIISVMDMAQSIYIDRFFKSSLAKATWRWHMRMLGKADVIIAISESTKMDITAWTGIHPQNIKVIQLSVPEKLYDIDQGTENDKAIRDGFGIQGPYFLYVGGLQFNKNIPILVEAFTLLSRSNKNISLLIAGENRFWPRELQDLKKQIEDNRLIGRVKLTGWATNRQLAALYRGAAALVHPSFYEGFGLTTLEAMFYGCPVITSNTSSLPEVVGDAGILKDPRQPMEFAQAMDRILKEPQLRAKLRESGYKNVTQFRWEKTARQTLEIYNQMHIK